MNVELVIKELPHCKICQLFIDNCNGHNLTEEILTAAEIIRTTLTFFPPNSTGIVQTCEALIIQKIESSCRNRWEKYTLDLIQSNA